MEHCPQYSESVFRIPPDIIDIIQETIYANSGSDTRTSILLSHVTRLWRKRALGNPRLWSHICISYPWNLQALETYLKRCKKYPLTIQVTLNLEGASVYNKQEHDDVGTDLRALGKYLLAHNDHLRQIEIRGNFGSFPFSYVLDLLLCELSDAELPLLKGLVIDGCDSVTEYDVSQPFNTMSLMPLLSSAKKLTTLALGPNALVHYTFPLASLTNVHLLSSRAGDRRSGPNIDIYKVLCKCKYLTQLTIDNTTSCYGNQCLQRIPSDLSLLRSIRFQGELRPSRSQLTALENLQELLVFPVSNIISGPQLGIEDNAQLFAKLTTFGTYVGIDVADQRRRLIGLSEHLPGLTHIVIAASNGEIQFPAKLLHIFPHLCEITLIYSSPRSIDLLSIIVSGFYTQRQFPVFKTLYLEKGNLKRLRDENSLRDDYPFDVKEADARHIPNTWTLLS